jgi:hypothetical protein
VVVSTGPGKSEVNKKTRFPTENNSINEVLSRTTITSLTVVLVLVRSRSTAATCCAILRGALMGVIVGPTLGVRGQPHPGGVGEDGTADLEINRS